MGKFKKHELYILLLIIGIAAFFRLYQLDQFPPGLYPDEAMNGNNAIQALGDPQNGGGGFKIFYPENNGREGLFINLQAISLKIFGISAWSLRLVSAIVGILTVWGLYLLTRGLFEWRIAALSSFLMAVSFWHVNFSRIGFRAILLPLVLVFGFYFLWRGLKQSQKFDFLMAGLFGGIGFYTYISYRIVPLIAVLLFINYWWYLKKDFSFSQYEYAKTKLLQGFCLAIITMAAVALPMGIHYWNNPDDFLGRAGGVSIFAQPNIATAAADSFVKTLGMFNFTGDWNQRHNISGAPMLHWLIGIFFVVGFLKELMHWAKRKHGHFSTAHTLLISWLFITLAPGFLSTEAPHALRVIGAIPVAMIFAARGIWWLMDKLSGWYKIRDPHIQQERHVVVAIVLVILLFAIGFVEYWRYFKVWGPAQTTADAFNQNYVRVAERLNNLPVSTKKYVLVNAGGVLVNGIPIPSQTVMFLTDTYTADKQKQKNIFYLTDDQFKKGNYDRRGVVIPLKND